MDEEAFKIAERRRDFRETGGGAGLLSALFFMVLGVLEGLAAGYFLWH